MTTSESIIRLSRLGFIYDEIRSSGKTKVFWYSFDGHTASSISFDSFEAALRFAEEY